MKTLQLPVNRGGQALPNFLYYNWACHARIISGWLNHFLHQEGTLVDAWCLAPFSPISLISIDKGESMAEVKNNPIMLNTWRDIARYVGQRGFSLALQPITQNKAFPPGVGKSIFNVWY